jgi:hypothetical protein
MVQEPESTAGGLLPLEFWVVVFMFPLGWHTDTYHTVVYDGGAFELCLPSLGNHYQNSLLRTQYLGSRSRSTWSWVRVATVWTLPRHVGLQHYEVSVGVSSSGLRPGLL